MFADTLVNTKQVKQMDSKTEAFYWLAQKNVPFELDGHNCLWTFDFIITVQ
jgi:DNA polymerase III psi subunit